MLLFLNSDNAVILRFNFPVGGRVIADRGSVILIFGVISEHELLMGLVSVGDLDLNGIRSYTRLPDM